MTCPRTRSSFSVQALCVCLAIGNASEPVLARGNSVSTARASVSSAGAQSNDFSSDIVRNRPSISGDGRYVAFESQASNLLPGDTNGTGDIFVRDTLLGATTRVSVSSAGSQANFESSAPEITPDGRFVLFVSSASNLATSDTNNSEDVFVHDRQTGATTCVSVTASGATGSGASGPGTYDSFHRRPITPDGRYVAFTSNATNLVAGDTNNSPDVFLRDRLAGSTLRVSVDGAGQQVIGTSSAPSITPDGRFVAFESTAVTLVVGDTNNTTDVFVKDLHSGTVVRVSTDSSGVQGNFLSFDPSLSSDGRVVAFQSAANNLVAGDTNGIDDLFVKRLDTGATLRFNLRPGGAQSTAPSRGAMLSRDGRFAAFWSEDPMLVTGDNNFATDIFVRDLVLGETRRVSIGLSGAEANAVSRFPDLSTNGLAVVYMSHATNLVPQDTNNKSDVFVHDVQLAGPVVFCAAKTNSVGCVPSIHSSGAPIVSPGAFAIDATQVVNNKTGLLFYGYGVDSAPFFGGTRCAQSPVRRTPVQGSAGNPPPNDCSGSYSFDMNAWIVSGVDPLLTVGARVVAQYWQRDAGSSFGAGLTDAVAFTVCP
jgi:Tol biopolymer transport system component